MPSERSLFRKIQTVVDIAKSVRVRDIAELCEEVEQRAPSVFNTSRYDASQDKFVASISPESIKRTVVFCRTLELITDDGVLSQEGREASRKSRFNETIGERVRIVLSTNGVRLSAMNSVIRDKLHANPPILPTAEVLWTELQPSMSRGMFSKLLTLLVYCDGGQSSQRKVYLGFS